MLLNMKELLKEANENQFAVPAFNISDYSMFNGVMDISEETKSPVIIEIHPDELSHMSVEAVCGIRERALKSKIPVCIHLDHGSTMSQILTAIQCGFTSVMIDGSDLPFDENIKICKEVVALAHSVGVSVEGELGTIGTADVYGEAGADVIVYTDPDNAAVFAEKTGVDALAIAIGTSHGIYPKDVKPKLELELLSRISEKVKVPLVLHGGSNNSDVEIAKAVDLGVSKINISSDIKAAYYEKMREVLKNPEIREPNAIQPPCEEALKKVVLHKIRLFKAEGKSILY